MTFKPILFNTEMVRAILEGRKTKTRRLPKFQPEYGEEIRMRKNKEGKLAAWFYCENPMLNPAGPSPWGGPEQEPPCQPGDVLWVRETWNGVKTGNPKIGYHTAYWYKADDKSENPDDRWRPSIHMPKEAARIFLRVTDVRVERIHKSFFRYGDIVHNISAEGIDIGDQCRECIETYGNPCCIDEESECGVLDDIRDGFSRLWDSTIKPAELDRCGWQQNPWVFVIKFERVDKPTEWEDYIK